MSDEHKLFKTKRENEDDALLSTTNGNHPETELDRTYFLIQKFKQGVKEEHPKPTVHLILLL